MFGVEEISNTAMLLILFLVIIPILVMAYLFYYDRKQKQQTILRNFPILGRMRYMLEKTGPELRQYLFDDDNDGKPFNREEYLHMALPGKYLNSVIGFGSKRDF